MAKPKLQTIFIADGEGDVADGELALGSDGRLYWNQKPIITEWGLTLTTMQKAGAVVTVIAAALGGFYALLQIIDWFKG